MAPFYLICFIALALFSCGIQSAQWSAISLPVSQKLYACAGNTVTFPWQYSLTSDEVLDDIQWLYDRQSQELMAIFSRGNFFPTPTFRQRVSRVDNAGLSLSRVLVQDSGNYSVEVNVYTQDGASRTVLRHTTELYVSDGLMTTDGVLHITLLRDPVYDSVSKQWVLQLQCGKFVFEGNPPYEVEWTTPSGSVHNSTSFSNGNFYLSIPMPIESGTYTCRIPKHLSSRACLHGNGSNEGRATVTVESSEARLLLLEKENSDLKATAAEQASRLMSQNQTVEDLKATVAEQASRLTSQNQSVEDLASRHNQIVEDLTSRLTALQSSLTQEVRRLNSQLSASTTDLQIRLGNIEDMERNQVAFHATDLLQSTVTANTPLVFNHVVYNQGNAYNSSTGYFTAPYSGLYFFAKTAGSVGTIETHYLIVDDLSVDWATNRLYDDPSPVHGVVHMTQGQQAYVRCGQNARLNAYYSAFTGFLLSRDL